MMNVGLTGNIAAGKSTVASLFARWGATVIDADVLVREVQVPGSPVLRSIRDRFGPGVMQQDGALDRAALRRMVTNDPEALAALNSIVHPAVGRLRSDRLIAAKAAGDLIVINDIPLLFEVLDPAAFDVIVLVDAPEETRLARLMGLRRLSRDEANRLIGAQMASAAKRPRSRFVIDNVGSLDDLERAAWDVWRAIRDEAASELLPGGG